MLLYGGSGHAKVILDCLNAQGVAVAGVFDDHPALVKVKSVGVLGKYNPEILPLEELIIAVGNNRIRQQITQVVKHLYGLAVHPSAIISPRARVGAGSVVFHQAVVQADATLGQHVIINTAATVDHDCVLGDFVHISPKATLCGNVQVGEGSQIGTGASVIPGINIGKWCLVGAGAAVVRDLPDYAVAVGVPAKIIKWHTP